MNDKDANDTLHLFDYQIPVSFAHNRMDNHQMFKANRCLAHKSYHVSMTFQLINSRVLWTLAIICSYITFFDLKVIYFFCVCEINNLYHKIHRFLCFCHKHCL